VWYGWGCGDDFSSLAPLVAGVHKSSPISPLYSSKFFMRNHCSFKAGNCVLYYLNSEFTNKIDKITNKNNHMTKIFAL
jgi:hypothetical protein